MTEHLIEMDWSARRLRDDPGKGHNRWHELVPPVLEIEPGDVVVADTRDGFDGQLTRGLTAEQYGRVSLLPNHAMTGPVFIKGAQPGDAIEIEVEDIEPDPFESYGATVVGPQLGVLRGLFDEVFIAHWDLHGREFAESEQLPGLRIPARPFMGLAGTAPSAAFRVAAREREERLAEAGGEVAPPDPEEALPAGGVVAVEGLRTIPPRENGGNLDIKQVEAGSSIFLPVYEPGALVSVGDAHYAQGDGESCGTAIEMRARMRLRFHLRRGVAASGALPWPVFTTASERARGRSVGVVGLGVENGVNHENDVSVATRQAVLAAVRLLERAGYSAAQAYAIVSVAADLHVSQAVDVPNVGVSAIIPLDIFTDGGARVLGALRTA